MTWTSDNPNVATVDEDGTVTGIGDGTATITATSVKDPTKSAACTVTVEVLKVTLTGALMDGSSTSQFYTWDMENDTTWTPGAVMEVDGITSTAYRLRVKNAREIIRSTTVNAHPDATIRHNEGQLSIQIDIL